MENEEIMKHWRVFLSTNKMINYRAAPVGETRVRRGKHFFERLHFVKWC